MKTLTTLLIVVSTLTWCSCEFSSGVKKDFKTGLSVSNDGFSIDGTYLVGSDNIPKDDNEVPMNSTVAIVLEGIGNYELKDGKAFPGLMLTVTDAKGNAVLDEPDLFSSNDGYSPTDASILRGTITVGNPMRSGETYHVKMRVWDKNKFENEIVAEVDIAVL